MSVQIFVKTGRAQMESYRRRAKEFYGEKYEIRIMPYVSTLVMMCRRDKNISPEEGARYLLARMKARRQKQGKKWFAHYDACLLSAALEVEDRGLLDEKTTPPTPSPESLPEDDSLTE